MEMVELRLVPKLLGATTRVMVARPLPEPAPDTVIHSGSPGTDQEQRPEAAVWIASRKVPPEAGTCNEFGTME